VGKNKLTQSALEQREGGENGGKILKGKEEGLPRGFSFPLKEHFG